MALKATVDEKYYQVAAPRSLGERLTIAARDRIYDDFIKHCDPGPADRILDIGVSDVVSDAANGLERKYPYPENITAVGLGEGDEFRAAFPAVAYRRIEANRPLPFADKSFDVAVSNAVLEHIGSPEHQVAFVRELVRVSRRVFITVPNRYFPVEHHTAIPVLHFWTKTFEFACKCLDKSEWADEQNLILMLRKRLVGLTPDGLVPVAGYTGIMLGMFSSNLFLYLDTANTPPDVRASGGHGR